MNVRNLVPRRVAGLPPGQRAIREFPRFADKPLRPAPIVGAIELTISVEGEPLRELNSDDLRVYETVEQTNDFHCVTTWTYQNARWSGVPVARVIADVLGHTTPPFAIASCADGHAAVFAAADLCGPDVLLATRLAGQPLNHRHGAPLRLVSPNQYGYKSAKHLVGIDFVAEEPVSTIGSKEHLRARVDHEERHAIVPGRLLRIPYRLIIIPTALAAERRLRKSPD